MSIVTPVGHKCCLLKLCRMNLAPTFSFYCWDFRPKNKNLVLKKKKKWLALASPAPSSFLKVTATNFQFYSVLTRFAKHLVKNTVVQIENSDR